MSPVRVIDRELDLRKVISRLPYYDQPAPGEVERREVTGARTEHLVLAVVRRSQWTAHVGADIAESHHIAIHARVAVGAPSKFDQQCRLSRARVRKWNRLISHQLRKICDPNGLVLVYGQPKRSSGGNPGDRSRLSLV